MAQARGRRAQLLMDFETTFGQDPVTPNAIKMLINSSSVRSSQNLVEDTTIRNDRNPGQPSRGNVDVSGSIVVPVDKIAIGYWMKAMFGDPDTTGVDAPYTHKFTPADSQPSLVLEQGFTDINSYAKLNGCKVGQFSISLGGDGELTASLDITGAKETIGDTAYDDTPTQLTLAKFSNFHASIQEGGVDLAIVTQADLTINFALDGDQYAIGTGGFRADIPEGIMQVTGTLRAFFEDTTLLNKAINGTETSLKLTLTDGDDKLEFLMPEVMFERNSPGIEGPQGVTIELPYRAYYNDSVEGDSIVVMLTNSQASY